MAHAAQLDSNNVVILVTVVPIEHASNVEEWCTEFGPKAGLSVPGDSWKETSYTGEFRKNFAGIGFTYDVERDAFIPPKPTENSELDEETCTWVIPPNEQTHFSRKRL